MSNQKLVYQLDSNGIVVGGTMADESPLEPGVWLLPAGCVETVPIPAVAGKLRQLYQGAWRYVTVPTTSTGSGQPSTDPVPYTTYTATQKVLADLTQQADWFLAKLRAGYPDGEVTSWAKQEDEARAYQANPTTAVTPLLTALAAARQVDFATLVAKVIQKADLFSAACGWVIGVRQRCEDQLDALGPDATVDQILAVKWPQEWPPFMPPPDVPPTSG